jgi:hypothetical protein
MKNMEREKFEESWKKAFDGAEVNPSDKVWTNIELDLEKAKGGDLKRRLLFYQMLAAASVVFAMAIGGIGYYYGFRTNQISGDRLALENAPSNENREQIQTEPNLPHKDGRELANSDDAPANTTNDSPAPEAESSAKKQQGRKGPTVAPSQNDGNDLVPAPLASNTADIFPPPRIDLSTNTADARNEALSSANFSLKQREVSPLYTPREIRLNLEDHKPQVDPVLAMLARLEKREMEVQDTKEGRKEAEKDGENLWTSVGFAAGSFNTMQASTSHPATSSYAPAMAAPIVDQEAKATGYSYSMGVNVGTRLSDRWVLQGGVNYLTHASEYIANNIVMDAPSNYQQQKFRAASTNELMSADAQELSSKLVYSAPYSVNNSMRYLSIPMMAGYLLVNKTFGLQLNAGVATDLFLQNTISAESDQIEKTSQPAGSDSPYRAVNLSGLIGTEISYRFGERYRVSLNPGIRYPFNTIYKSELGVQAAPLTLDVGLRFRYIFN